MIKKIYIILIEYGLEEAINATTKTNFARVELSSSVGDCLL